MKKLMNRPLNGLIKETAQNVKREVKDIASPIKGKQPEKRKPDTNVIQHQDKSSADFGSPFPFSLRFPNQHVRGERDNVDVPRPREMSHDGYTPRITPRFRRLPR